MTNLLLALFVPCLLAGADPAPKPTEIVYVKFGVIKVNGEIYKKIKLRFKRIKLEFRKIKLEFRKIKLGFKKIKRKAIAK